MRHMRIKIFYFMKIKSIKEINNLEGKKVILRADLNVPIKKGKVQDDFKIFATLPTIGYLLKRKAKIMPYTGSRTLIRLAVCALMYFIPLMKRV